MIKEKISMLMPNIKGFAYRFKRNKNAVVGLFITVFILLVGIFSPWIAPYPPTKTNVGPVFSPPGIDHPFGTDNVGRDLFSDCIHGTRTAIMVGLVSVGVSTLIGIVIGAISGYFGGKVDEILMRITEFFIVLPRLLLALIFAAFFGSSLRNVILIIAFLSWPGTARLLRSEFLYKKELFYVEAAKSVGMSSWRIIFTEILPNSLSQVIINTSLQISTAILTESNLSFLGLGDPSIASWGKILSNAQAYLRSSWWLPLFPGLILTLVVLSLNMLGDGVNDTLNPKLREL